MYSKQRICFISASLLWILLTLSALCSENSYSSNLSQIRTLYRAKKFSQAHKLALQLLQLQEKSEGKDSPALIETLNLVIASACAQDRCKDTTPWLVRQLELRKKNLGENHPHVAVSLCLLGENAESKGNWLKAEQYYQSALELRKKIEPALVEATGRNLDRVNRKRAKEKGQKQ